MRRPLALAGFTCLPVTVLCLMAGADALSVLLAAASLLFLLFLILWAYKRRSTIRQALCACSFFAVLAVALYTVSTAAAIAPWEACDGMTADLRLTVIERTAEYGSGSYYLVTADPFPDAPAGGSPRLELAVYGSTAYQAGDVLSGSVRLSAIAAQRRVADHANGVVLTARPARGETLQKVDVARGIPYYAAMCRNYLKGVFADAADGEESALIAGVCLGDSSGLSAAAKQAFRACGLSHLTAVSGLHTGMVAGWCVLLLLLLRVRSRWAGAAAMGFVWAFVLIAGAPYSALRAALMATALAIGSMTLRKPDPLNTLGGAVLVILLIRPAAAGDVGFLTSVCTCAAVLTLAEPITRSLCATLPKIPGTARIGKAVCAVIGVTVAAWLGLIPVNLLCFKTASLIAPIANLLCIPMAGVVLFGGLTGAILSVLPPLRFLMPFPLTAARLAARLMLTVTAGLSSFPYATVSQGGGWCLAATGVLFAAGTWLWKARRRLSFWGRRCVALVLILLLPAAGFLPRGSADSTAVFAVGEADGTGVAVVSRDQTVVIGCDHSDQLTRLLAGHGVTQIDCLILPDRSTLLHSLRALTGRMPVKRIVISRKGLARGLAQGFDDGDTAVDCRSTVTLAGVTVTTEDFETFSIAAGAAKLTYCADPKEPVLSVADGARALPLTGTVAARVEQNALVLYRPSPIF